MRSTTTYEAEGQSHPALGRDHQFAALGWSEAQAREELRKRLPRMQIGNKSQVISILIEVLRSLPPEDTTVSKDCMVTTIQRVPPHAWEI
jgi:hypothetical protein